MFSLGGIICLSTLQHVHIQKSNSYFDLHINLKMALRAQNLMIFSLLILTIGFPFYFYHILSVISTVSGNVNIFDKLRTYILSKGSSHYASLINYLVPLSTITSFIVVRESNNFKQYKFLVFLSVLLALSYNILSGSRSGLVALLIEILFIFFIQEKKINTKLLVGGLILVASIFSGLGVFLFDAGMAPTESLIRIVKLAGIELLSYVAAPVIAFWRITPYPLPFPRFGDILIFFKRIANLVGANYHIFTTQGAANPSYYITIGHRSGLNTYMSANIYTIYFFYFSKYGWEGMITLMLILGFLITLNYFLAICGNRLAIIYYGVFAYGILSSGYSESIFTNMDFLIKILIVSLFFELLVHLRGINKSKLNSPSLPQHTDSPE